MNRNRELPTLVEGTRSKLGIPVLYDSLDESSNPRHPNFSQLLESQSQSAVAVVSSQSQTGAAILVPAQHAHVGSGNLHQDFGGNGGNDDGESEDSSSGSDTESEKDRDTPPVSGDESSSGDEGLDSDGSNDDDNDNPLPAMGPLPDPLPWNGVAPPSRTEFDSRNKLSMRYPRRRQLKKLMKECYCHVHVAQWAAKHRRFVCFELDQHLTILTFCVQARCRS